MFNETINMTPQHNQIKITVIGGSSSATPTLVGALLAGAASLPPLELALVGRSTNRLEAVASVARRLIAQAGVAWRVSTATEVARALDGSRFVINQVRVGGMRARDYDETFPHAANLPGDETAGPGGLANALRSLPVYLEYARIIEREAPDATLLQLSNPANPAVTLLRRHSSIPTIGFCDQPVTALATIAGLLGTTDDAIDVDYGGLNHLGFVLRVRQGGADVTQQAIAALADQKTLGIAPDLVRALGVIPTPYLKVIYHADEVATAQRARPQSRAQELLQLEQRLFEAYADPLRAEEAARSDERGAGKWYRGVLLALLQGLTGAAPQRLVLITRNGDALPDLPPDATVEVLADVDQSGVRGRGVGPLPPSMRGLVQQAAAHEELVLAAALDPSESTVLAALVADPLVPSYAAARTLVGPVLDGLRIM